MGLKHYDYGGQARFVTFCTHNQLSLLNNERFFDVIIEAIKTTKELLPFNIFGYVLMPEHVHVVLRSDNNNRAGHIVGEIKRLSSKRIHKMVEMDFPEMMGRLTVIRNRVERFALWQRRCYDYNCRSEEILWEKVNYCHNNPVRRGLVRSPCEWKWSSYGWYNGESKVLLVMDALP
jgi:putative transposase